MPLGGELDVAACPLLGSRQDSGAVSVAALSRGWGRACLLPQLHPLYSRVMGDKLAARGPAIPMPDAAAAAKFSMQPCQKGGSSALHGDHSG